METTNVFLDTTEFDRNAFNFGSKQFSNLLSKINSSKLKIFIADVIESEIKIHFHEYSKKAIKEIKKFSSEDHVRFLKHLSNPPFKTILNLEFEDIKAAWLKDYEIYKKLAKITVISTENINVKSILDLYFGKFPPFGEERKKEFPDAICLLAIKEWSSTKGQKIYVVSQNKDFKGFCEGEADLLYLSSLSELLEIVTNYENKISLNFHRFIEDNLYKLKSDIEERFLEIEIIANDYELDAEFENTEILNVDLLSWNIIDTSKNIISIEFTANITFKSDVTYSDYGNAIYNSETGELVAAETGHLTIEDKIFLQGSFDYNFYEKFPVVWEDIRLEKNDLRPDIIEINLGDWQP